MGIFSGLIGGAVKTAGKLLGGAGLAIGGTKLIKQGGALLGGAGGGLATGVVPAATGAVAGAVGTTVVQRLQGPKKRRRRSRGLTKKQMQDLIMLKAAVGTRSPLFTIKGIDILK